MVGRKSADRCRWLLAVRIESPNRKSESRLDTRSGDLPAQPRQPRQPRQPLSPASNTASCNTIQHHIASYNIIQRRSARRQKCASTSLCLKLSRAGQLGYPETANKGQDQRRKQVP